LDPDGHPALLAQYHNFPLQPVGILALDLYSLLTDTCGGTDTNM
jgi:hypothetical protein